MNSKYCLKEYVTYSGLLGTTVQVTHYTILGVAIHFHNGSISLELWKLCKVQNLYKPTWYPCMDLGRTAKPIYF